MNNVVRFAGGFAAKCTSGKFKSRLPKRVSTGLTLDGGKDSFVAGPAASAGRVFSAGFSSWGAAVFSGNVFAVDCVAGFALPFVIYNAKLVLWDKVLGLGSTDGLSAELFQVELACIGFYFLYDIAARFKR